MKQQNILFLIDYSSLLSTSFFATLPMAYKFAKTDEEKDELLPKLLQTSFGAYTNGVSVMMTKLEKIIKNVNPKYLAGGFDLTRNTFRREYYPLYKMNRTVTRFELASQFAISQEIMKEMNMPFFAFHRYEADDVIGTLSKKFGEDIKTIILTKDQDMLQLIRQNVSVWLMTSKSDEMYDKRGIKPSDFGIMDGVFEYNEMTFEEEYGFKPIQMIDNKSLIGDTSDNIPGVKGVGEKAVVPLLKEFETVEYIYDYIESTPEKEAKAFMKELGISRSPISCLTKELPVESQLSNKLISTLDELLSNIGDKVPDLEGVKAVMEELSSSLITEPPSEFKLVGKGSALMSKALATIMCGIPELQDITLEDLELKIDIEGRKRAYTKYEFNTLLNRI